jgi:hypothetical protein
MIEAGRIYSWQPNSIQNCFEFVYASFYDGVNSLRLFTPELRHFREEIYKQSIRNPKVFSEFFGLDFPVPPNSHCDLCFNSLLRQAIVLTPIGKPEASCPVFGMANDLEFSVDQTFFKVNKFVVEKVADKDFKDLLQSYKVEITDQRVFVDRFFSVSGFKLLFSNSLKNLATDLMKALSPVIDLVTKKVQSKDGTETAEAREVAQDPLVRRRLSTMINPSTGLNSQDHNPNLAALDYDSTPKAKCLKEYICALVINKPQINMYDDSTETQVLFGSDGDSVLLISNDYLEYDAFHQDPKFLVDFHFHNLNLYTGALTSPLPPRLSQALHLGRGRGTGPRLHLQNATQFDRHDHRAEPPPPRQPQRHSELRPLRLPLPLLPQPHLFPEIREPGGLEGVLSHRKRHLFQPEEHHGPQHLERRAADPKFQNQGRFH